MQQGVPIGPWPLGIDNVSRDTDMRADPRSGKWLALRDAVNVDIDRGGSASRRSGGALTHSLPGAHSFWGSPAGAFVVAAGTLYSVTESSIAPVTTLNSNDPCAYTELLNGVAVTNRTTLLEVRGGVARPLGLPDVSTPHAVPSPNGGLPQGRYAVAVALVRADGYEGGMSPASFVEVPEGGGISVSGLPTSSDAAYARVYRSSQNGTALYRAADAPMGASLLLGTGDLGREATTPWLRRMQPGSHIAFWRGRIATAYANWLNVSRPMDYGLHSPRHGFVQFPYAVTMLAAVEAGLFVGSPRGVVFLRGGKPSEWVWEETGCAPPVPHAVGYVDGGVMDPEMGLSGQRCAVWMSRHGFVVATPDGRTLEVQSDRVAAPEYERGSLAVHGRRATVAVA